MKINYYTGEIDISELVDLLTQLQEVGLDSGQVSSATSITLTDNTKNWGSDMWAGAYVEITEGTGQGQIRKIDSNTADTLTIATPWDTIPDTTSKYRIFGALGGEKILADIRDILQANFDTTTSSRASESTLSSILSQLDITLSQFRDAITAPAPDTKTLKDLYDRLTSILTQLDVALSTRASEATLSSIDGKITKCNTDNVTVVSTANPSNLDVPLSDIKSLLGVPKTQGLVELIDFRESWHASLFPQGTLVDLDAEGIGKPYPEHSGKAIKIDLAANANLFLDTPICKWYICSDVWLYMMTYATGTAQLKDAMSGFPLTLAGAGWWEAATFLTRFDYLNLLGGSSGGSIYIALVAIARPMRESWQQFVALYDTLNFGQSKTYRLNLPALADYLQLHMRFSGTNMASLDIQIRSYGTLYTLMSYASGDLIAPVAELSIPMRGIYRGVYGGAKYLSHFQVLVKATAKSTGTNQPDVLICAIPIWHDTPYYEVFGYVSGSVSETAGTLTTYNLLDTHGKACRLKAAKVDFTVDTLGEAYLYVNGKLFYEIGGGATTTVEIPDDIDIFKVDVKLKNASATFEGVKLEGPYLVEATL